MIDIINNDVSIYQAIAGSLEEEGISVQFGESLHDQYGEPDLDRVAILKPDLFYSTVNFAMPPKSVDGVIVVSDDGGFHFYIAELKSSKLKDINKRDIEAKFDTIFNRFLAEDFSHIFLGEYSLKKLNLWLVCDPLGLYRGVTDRAEIVKRAAASERLRGLMAEVSISMKIYKFKGRAAMIRTMLSPPMIEQGFYHEILV